MKKTIKVLISLLVVCLMICIVPEFNFDVSAATYTSGDLTYSIYNAQATITDCKETASGVLVLKRVKTVTVSFS